MKKPITLQTKVPTVSRRLISFDTETTGLYVDSGDRVIEIGAVEILDRIKTKATFQTYLNPEGKAISEGAKQVTNINDSDLKKAPFFRDIMDDFINFVKGSELIIHNAQFDVGFINNELKLAKSKIKDIRDICSVYDTLVEAKEMFPGQRNNLDALSKRLNIKGYDRTFHGALLDAQILADTYLNMTGGQVSLDLKNTTQETKESENQNLKVEYEVSHITIGKNDQSEHEKFLKLLSQKSKQDVSW